MWVWVKGFFFSCFHQRRMPSTAATTISKSILFCVAVVGALFSLSNFHSFFVCLSYILRRYPSSNFKWFFSEMLPFETQLTRKTTRLRMRVWVCDCTSIGTGWLPMCWFLLTNLYGFFYCVFACFGGKSWLCPARACLRGLLLFVLFLLYWISSVVACFLLLNQFHLHP